MTAKAPTPAAKPLPREQLVEFLSEMLLIRGFEEKVEERFRAGELALSGKLRRWFGHDPQGFDEFRRRYTEELAAQDDKLRDLRRRARQGTLKRVYGARDTELNDAVVLAEILRVGRRSR